LKTLPIQNKIIFYLHIRVYYHLLVTIYIMSWWLFHRLAVKKFGFITTNAISAYHH